jgi:prepilin peptidase CpaA
VQKKGRYKLGNHALKLLTIFCVLALQAAVFHLSRADATVYIASLFLTAISITDILRSKIPNMVNMGFLLCGLLLNSVLLPKSFSFILAGLAVGFSVFLIPYLAGGMGAGDVKAFAVLGAILGPSAVFQVFLYTALAGGAVALLHHLAAGHLRRSFEDGWTSLGAFAAFRDIRCVAPASSPAKSRFPYAPVMAFGYFAHLLWGNLV